jgi:Protein of unknown function (DUF3016)
MEPERQNYTQSLCKLRRMTGAIMNRFLQRGLCVLALGFAAAQASATTTVTFVKPVEFTDIGFYNQESSMAMNVLEQHFKTLGERYLAPNQNLKVEVLDVDLAGRVEYGNWRFYDKRVLRGMADWPRIKFHYVLETDGKVVTDNEADIADMAYLNRLSTQYGNVTYPYEMHMLEDWFKGTFSSAKTSR